MAEPVRNIRMERAGEYRRSLIIVTSDGSVLHLQGELDLSNVEGLWARMESAIAASGSDVVLDLSALTFIDSSGIALFIRAVRRLDPGRRLVLDRPSRSVRRVIDITGIAAVPGIALQPGAGERNDERPGDPRPTGPSPFPGRR